MAVVGGVGRERLAAVFALEGLLPRVLPDVRAEYAGRRELLPGTESRKVNLHSLEDQLNKGFHFVTDA